jgi:hypothetical protein
MMMGRDEKPDDPAVSTLGVRSRKPSNVRKVSHKMAEIYYLELLCASEGTLS